MNPQPVSPGELTITVAEHLGDWALPWDALVESLPIPSPFLRSWWLEGTAGRRPRFVLVIEGDNLLGGLALEEGRALGLPAFRLMGAGALCPDHLDIVARPEQGPRVVGAVAAWMSRQGVRIFDLEGVVADSLLSLAVPRRARGEVIAVAPWLPVPVDFSCYLASRPRGFRTTLRKASRLLAAQGLAHRAIRSPSPETALHTLRQLHEGAWGEDSPFLAAFDRFAQASQRGAESGEVVFHELADDETVVASIVGFEVAGRVSLYQSGRIKDQRWRNAATVLLSAIIEDASRRGLLEVDFLRGDEGYKWGFASDVREIYRLRAAKGVVGGLAVNLLVLVARARIRLGRLARSAYARAAPVWQGRRRRSEPAEDDGQNISSGGPRRRPRPPDRTPA